MIDAGDCDNITAEELDEISSIINRPATMGREDAAKLLGVSLNRFHDLRSTHKFEDKTKFIIDPPRSVKGQKEKMYYRRDLLKSLEYIKLHKL